MKSIKYIIKEKELADFVLFNQFGLRLDIDMEFYDIEIIGCGRKKKFIFKYKHNKQKKKEQDKLR